MATTPTYSDLAKHKLQAFERLQPEFEKCFHFVQDVHGQRRFSTFPISETVYYLHALWICECKDRLLSIYKHITRYEGHRCLALLRCWQTGESSEVIAFLQRKLDGMPFADLTRQIQEMSASCQGESGVIRRLKHGRRLLLNRGMTLMQALDAIFALPEERVMQEVQAACDSLGHRPSQIERQLVEMEDPLYAYAPHQSLARRNMLVMNALGVAVMDLPTDQPGDRSWKVLAPKEPLRPFAQHAVAGYIEQLSPWYNNLMGHRFFDLPEQNRVAHL